MKNVLILHISEFGGHSKAAENIEEALYYRDSQLRILSRNGFGYFYPRGEKVIDFLYNTVIKHFPDVWGKLYDRKKVIKQLTPVMKVVNRVAFGKLSTLIEEFNPQCFVTTQAFPCGVIADYKKKFGLDTPLVAVVTDYYPHRFWIHRQVDRYVVACQEAKDILMREGVAENKVKVLGIPISVKFMNSYPREEIAKKLGLVSHLDSVLLMGGGFGMGPIQSIAKRLDALAHDFQMVVVCGRNKKLYNWFTENKSKFKKPIFHFGYIDFVHQLMDFSDIIVTKAGGITVSEALAKGVAIIITHPLPGQEERNVDCLLKRGAIIDAGEAQRVSVHVADLFEDKKKLYELKEKAKEISFIDSSIRIVDLIMGEIS